MCLFTMMVLRSFFGTRFSPSVNLKLRILKQVKSCREPNSCSSDVREEVTTKQSGKLTTKSGYNNSINEATYISIGSKISKLINCIISSTNASSNCTLYQRREEFPGRSGINFRIIGF